MRRTRRSAAHASRRPRRAHRRSGRDGRRRRSGGLGPGTLETLSVKTCGLIVQWTAARPAAGECAAISRRNASSCCASPARLRAPHSAAIASSRCVASGSVTGRSMKKHESAFPSASPSSPGPCRLTGTLTRIARSGASQCSSQRRRPPAVAASTRSLIVTRVANPRLSGSSSASGTDANATTRAAPTRRASVDRDAPGSKLSLQRTRDVPEVGQARWAAGRRPTSAPAGTVVAEAGPPRPRAGQRRSSARPCRRRARGGSSARRRCRPRRRPPARCSTAARSDRAAAP